MSLVPCHLPCGMHLWPSFCQINWVEVNAALGQLSMLLLLISSRVGCCFAKYQPIAMGSFSRMARTNDMKKSSELYVSFPGLVAYALGLFHPHLSFAAVRTGTMTAASCPSATSIKA